MSPFTLFRSAVCAGFAIGLGGAVYLQQTSKALGALLFTVGLFAVCECRFHLFRLFTFYCGMADFCHPFFMSSNIPLSQSLDSAVSYRW